MFKFLKKYGLTTNEIVNLADQVLAHDVFMVNVIKSKTGNIKCGTHIVTEVTAIDCVLQNPYGNKCRVNYDDISILFDGMK